MPKNTQLEILAQLFKNLSESDKAAFLMQIADKPSEQPVETLSSFRTKSSFLRAQKMHDGKNVSCPVCAGLYVVKNGTSCGTQRYLCRECGKSFGETENSILKDTKKGTDVWCLYVKCMIEKKSIRKCAEVCQVSVPTSFFWRHKILDALQNMMAGIQLNGVIEADETFTAVSCKGRRKNLPRELHQRATKAEKRGLFGEKVCGINMNGLSIAGISNLGKPGQKDIPKVLGGKVDKGSVLIADSFRGYHKPAADMEVTHIRIPCKKHTNGAFNIQLLNNYYSQMKELINVGFNGVSTKHLNSYRVYHNMVNFSKGDDQFKEDIMFRFAMSTKCMETRSNVFNRSLMPIS